MKRGELGKLVDLFDDVIVDEDRLVEVLAALDDAMPDRIDFVEGFDGGVVTVDKRVQYERMAASWSAICASMTTSFSSIPCLWKAFAEPTRSQMPFAMTA